MLHMSHMHYTYSSHLILTTTQQCVIICILQMRKFRLRKIEQTSLLRNKAWNRAQVYLPPTPEIFLAGMLFQSLPLPQIVITLLTKVQIVNAMVFPVVTYGCERWTVKQAEH